MKTFLIADDSPAKVILLISLLKHAGWKDEILVGKTTEEAEHLINHHSIHAGFIDYQMPMKNGPYVIRHLRKKHPEAKIALTSASDNPDFVYDAMEAGADTSICTSKEADEVERMVSEFVAALA